MAVDDARALSARPGSDGRARGYDPARLIGDERLPCGRLVGDAWKQARAHPDDPDPHTARCAYCRQAVEGLAALDRATRTLRTQRPSARVVAQRVITAVRAEARLGRMVPLDDPGRDLRIAEVQAAKVLRGAADRIHGVRAASCRLTLHSDGLVVDVAMTLAATLELPLPERGTEVRRAVADAARQQLGLAVGRIDVTFVSILEPVAFPAAARRRTA
ncbi:hypothetical protein [Actinacidiphila acidipaludis]|uniref:Asp23/Gls24 family envelope stress response protein n=1 Tax=Actinacidiphila acidipaludis TaxID=2873382 RepID=A0ABS7Q276_9ACTN|nr:hypothetical protein [Streptomyces acidipaludis]MBY8877238.1 hypothetical protein [Streptomyces acidipaludis]